MMKISLVGLGLLATAACSTGDSSNNPGETGKLNGAGGEESDARAGGATTAVIATADAPAPIPTVDEWGNTLAKCEDGVSPCTTWDECCAFGGGEVTYIPPEGGCPRTGPQGECLGPENDEDRDGYTKDVDCNDHDPEIFPGQGEGVLAGRCNGVDEDCDGVDYCPVDRDGDGLIASADCDDENPLINFNTTEILCNGMDEDCTASDECDRDGDGDVGQYPLPVVYTGPVQTRSGYDCNDSDPHVNGHANTTEILCDGIDQNCRYGDCCDNDDDGDGSPCRLDCDDQDPRKYPGAPVSPSWCFGDYNCDGVLDGTSCTQ